MIELNKVYNEDCLEGMKRIPDASVSLVLTDIPYNECNRPDNGLRSLNKEYADVGLFNLKELTSTLCRKTKGSIYMFCGINQLSTIRSVMQEYKLSTRVIVWEKTNPSPMNGNKIWLSGVELCVYGKKTGGGCLTFIVRIPCYVILADIAIYTPHKSPLNCFVS